VSYYSEDYYRKATIPTTLAFAIEVGTKNNTIKIIVKLLNDSFPTSYFC